MLQPDDVLAGRYRLHERVGGGGMGDVWRGEDTVLGRPVAVKVLRAGLSEESNFRERFRREARAIAALEAPGIVDVYDYGEADGPDGQTQFLVMQFVDGMPLSRRLAGWGPLRTQDTLQIMSQVADALDAAHEVGIIHRDVKPGNILLREDGRVILVDFGIARSLGNLTMTSFGVVLGTVAYMSPEQASGEKLGPTSDIYSLGVVAHQCLTGELPFKAETPLALLAAHLRTEVPRLPDTVPRSVASLITRAMAKEPRDRWGSAARFAAACRQASLEPMLPVPDGEIVSSQVRQSVPQAPVSHPPVSAAPPLPPQAAASRPVHPVSPSSAGFEAPTGPQPDPATAPGVEASVSVPSVARPGTRGRRLVYPLTVAVMVIALAGAVTAMARPWEAADFAQDTRERQDGDNRTTPAVPGNGEIGAGISPIGSPDKPKGTPGSPTSHAESPHGDPATSAPGSPSLETVTVPDVLAYNESDARATLENARLNPTVSYVGDGEVTCSVTTQDPPGGGQATAGSTVSITVQRTIEVCPQ